MEKIKIRVKSVRFKLFFTMCIVVSVIVVCLIAANNMVFETFYINSKTKTVRGVYNKINDYYKYNIKNDIKDELRRIAFNNNFDIFIKTDENVIIFSTDRDVYITINNLTDINKINDNNNFVIYEDKDVIIKKISNLSNNVNYILLTGTLCNNYKLYIRIPVVPIEESVQISNRVLIIIGGITIVISAIIASYVSKKFTEPILQLNEITDKMAKLDFSQKYIITDTENEINELGSNINTMSDKLETTIKQLRENNMELEKDIEEKSKIDEMRKQFISDVSHELKTPIALIQGYAEGLVENVNTDEESKKFYAEVILDESNKMDRLVKQLLELMKLEYGKREFKNEILDIVELTKEVIRKCNVIIEEKKINVEFNIKDSINVIADEFYIEQVVTNYLTNAIKHCEEKEGIKKIVINIEENSENNKVRFSIFNTGDNIPEEDIKRIWGRFYKLDSSRNREDGGSGIGLALVKAIMNNYQNAYGVLNKENGVEFYFELDKG